MENASQNYMIGRLFIPMMLMNLFEAAQILYYLQRVWGVANGILV